MNSQQILVVAPSLSPACGKLAHYQKAVNNLKRSGYDVIWAPKAKKALDSGFKDRFDSMTPEDKLNDFAWALKQDGQIIISAIGGYNSYHLLDKLPFDRLAKQGKILIGHSDPTLILNAFYSLTGKASWYGPNLRNLGDSDTGDISTNNFVKALHSKTTIWTRSALYKDNFESKIRQVRNWQIIQEGTASGIGIGGNIGTFYLLQGTKYVPRFDRPTVLFLEEDEMPGKSAIREFDRRLRSILDQPGASKNIRGLLIGRFLDVTKTKPSDISAVVSDIAQLKNKPVIANVEFGHGMPRILLPVGGQILIKTNPLTITVSL